MNALRYLLVISIFCLWVGGCALHKTDSAQILRETQVIQYKPPSVTPTVDAPIGDCWSRSLASARTDAWRCAIGNAIYDPCFATNRPKVLWCGVGEMGSQPAGFPIRLAKSLPKEKEKTSHHQSIRPWLLELADGSLCAPNTGTLPSVQQQIIYYGCSPSTTEQNNLDTFYGLLGEPKVGKIWTVRKIAFGPSDSTGQSPLLSEQTVAVRKVWQ